MRETSADIAERQVQVLVPVAERQVLVSDAIFNALAGLSPTALTAALYSIAWLQVRGGETVPSRAELRADGPIRLAKLSAKTHRQMVDALAKCELCYPPRQGVPTRWMVEVTK